jgi:intracellular sulfur oxidation DsrE/DsrF family protein
MTTFDTTHRRGFLGRLVGAVAGVGATFGATQTAAAQQASGPDAWLATVRGTNRTLFDFPQHRGGVPQLHILNYLNTYSAAYKTAAGQASAVGTFYGIGPQASISLAFNDAMWAKYALGEYTGLKDAAGRPYTRNVLNRPTKDDLHVVMTAMQTPTIPMFADAMPAIGIESLQKMGTTFLLCANAFGAWCAELEVRGKGKASELQHDLTANLLPGVVIVPAMVIAIEKAQRAGITYNRQ